MRSQGDSGFVAAVSTALTTAVTAVAPPERHERHVNILTHNHECAPGCRQLVLTRGALGCGCWRGAALLARLPPALLQKALKPEQLLRLLNSAWFMKE